MRKSNAILAFFCFALFGENICAQQLSSLPQDDSETIQVDTAQLPPTYMKKPILVTIDLSECSCTGTSSCDFTILKSSLVDITCVDGESLCCPMTKSAEESSESETGLPEISSNEEHPSEIAPKSNVRVYSITPTIIKDFDSSAPEEETFIKSQKNKSRKCACKPRSSCPHKNIDYGFGFYCTYNTVRCCISEEDEPEQITISVDMDNETAEYQPVLSVVNTTVENADIVSESGSSPVAYPNSSETTTEFIFNATTSEMNSTAADEDSRTLTLAMAEIENVIDKSNASMESNVSTAPLAENVTTPEGDDGEEQTRLEQAAKGVGELIITEITNWSDLENVEDESYQKEVECFCLPIQKCRIAGSYDTNNMIERRRDTLCPGDSVQCCGGDVLNEITKKRDDIAEEYDMVTPIKSDMPEPPPQQANQYLSPSSSNSFLLANDTNMGLLPAQAQETQTFPTSSILPAPFPGYQPPGFYKGYGYQYPAKSHLGTGQQGTANQYYRYGQQQQLPQNQYDATGSQSYTPWTYNKYVPNEPVPGGVYPPRNSYGETDSSRHKSGGLLDALSKFLG